MIDLKKLEKKFEALFEQETEQSFNEWLEGKKQREVMAFLGKGEIENLKIRHPEVPRELLSMPINVCSHNEMNTMAGNTQFAMAA
jgi:hypothetical protein